MQTVSRISKILSTLIVFGVVVRIYLASGTYLCAVGLVALLLPLSAIWFSEQFGQMVGDKKLPMMGGYNLTTESPGWLVQLLGWALLLLVGFGLLKIARMIGRI